MLLISTQRASEGIQQKAFRLIDRVGREVFELQIAAQRDIFAVTVSLAGVIGFAGKIRSFIYF